MSQPVSSDALRQHGSLCLTDFFEAFAAKPDIIIDDMPGTAHPAFAFDVNRESGWPEMVHDILRKHIDPR